jgi:transposase-like protein
VKKNYQTKTSRAATGRVTPKKKPPTAPPATDEMELGLPDWALPPTVRVAMTDLAETAREGLLALAVGAGLGVLQMLMDEDVTAAAGPKVKWNPDRVATRHGYDGGEVTLGGRRVPIQRPRVRSADGSTELPMPTYELFSSTEILGRMAMERMLAKLSTRRYRAGLEPVGTTVEIEARSTSKSAVSRRFVAATETALASLMAGDLSGLDLVALMVDGVHFAGHCCVVALGIDIDGTKHPLGVMEGSTENATLITELIVDLRERGLDPTKPILAVIDGSKALRRAILDVFDHALVHRCQLHKIRNLEHHLPASLASTVTTKMQNACRLPRRRPPCRRGSPRKPRSPVGQGSPWRGCLVARGAVRDADHRPPRHAAHPGPHASVHQRHRVHDRDLSGPLHQREALAGRPDGAALVCGRDGRGLQAVPPRERVHAPTRPTSRS